LLQTAGWDEGCLTMKMGEKAQLTIAGYKGYGAQGFPAWGYPFVVLCFTEYCHFYCVVAK